MVPPAATAPVASLSSYLYLRISGSAICAIVAAVARLEPQIAANAPQAADGGQRQPAAAMAEPGIAGAVERLVEPGLARDVAHQHEHRDH